MKKGNKNELFNFGKGWGTIIFCLLMFWFYAGMVNDSSNVVAPAVAEKLGIPAGNVLNMGTVAAMVGVIFFFVMGAVNRKIGPRVTSFICLILGGVGYFGMGHANSLAQYAIALCICTIGCMSAGYISGGAFVAQWFPKKKGIVMGITTIGMNLASALINWILSGLSGQFQISGALSILGGVVILLAILLGIFVKATPEEAGCYPDNDPEIAAIIKAEEEGVKEMEKVSYAGALKNKYVWIFGLGAGFFGLATVGIMSQLVSYFMAARGYELTGALSMLTIAAVIGMIGSWAWGVVDQKLGTQKACLMFGIWYFIGIAFLIAPPTPCMYIGLFMLGGAIGGNGNFLPSLAAQVFGRKDFNVSYACMNMICGIVRSCSFFVLAVLRSMTSGYTVPYVVFAVIAVIGGILIVAVKEKKAIQ